MTWVLGGLVHYGKCSGELLAFIWALVGVAIARHHLGTRRHETSTIPTHVLQNDDRNKGAHRGLRAPVKKFV